MDIESIQQTINELEQLAQELEAQDETIYQSGDMVNYTHEGEQGVALVESVSENGLTVRVMAVAGDNFEPTDDVLMLSADDVSPMDSDNSDNSDASEDDDSEEEESSQEENEDEEVEKGMFVSWQSKLGAVQGCIVDVSEKEAVIIPETGEEFSPEDGKLCLIEVYQKNKDEFEDTGVHVALQAKDLEVIDPLDVKQRRLMVKAKNFEMKEDDEKKFGFLSGIGSAYGKVDLGGDTVKRGAYTQTINHNDGKVQLMFNHGWEVSDVAGIAKLEDSEEGLMVEGKMPLHVNSVKDGYEIAKFMLEEGKPLGFSIGYQVIKSEPLSNGVRELQEIALEEMTITPWPMDTHARIRDAKSRKITYHSKRRGWQSLSKAKPNPDAPTGNQLQQGEYKSLVDELRNIKQTIEENHV